MRSASVVNGALNNFPFAATLPEARGVFIDTGDLIRLWECAGFGYFGRQRQ